MSRSRLIRLTRKKRYKSNVKKSDLRFCTLLFNFPLLTFLFRILLFHNARSSSFVASCPDLFVSTALNISEYFGPGCRPRAFSRHLDERFRRRCSAELRYRPLRTPSCASASTNWIDSTSGRSADDSCNRIDGCKRCMTESARKPRRIFPRLSGT